MLSLAPITLKQKNYYLNMSQNDYYAASAEQPGTWYGDVAKQLCSGTQVQPDHFERLMLGLHPKDQSPLINLAAIRLGYEHQPGWDICLSVPKTLSAMWSVSPQEVQAGIEGAHSVAVDATIRYYENNLAVTRRGHGGRVREPVHIIAAKFLHWTSRNLDPQLHTHVIVLNVAQRHDGSFGTIVSKPIYDHQKELGAFYRTSLAVELRRNLGLRLEVDSPEVVKAQGYQGFRLQDVPKALGDAFSSRRKEIVAEMKERGVWGPKAAETAALATRKPKRSLPIDELREQWRRIAAQHHFGQEQVADILYRDRKLMVKDTVAAVSKQAVNEAEVLLDHSRVSFDRVHLFAAAAARTKPGTVPPSSLEQDAAKVFSFRKQAQSEAESAATREQARKEKHAEPGASDKPGQQRTQEKRKAQEREDAHRTERQSVRGGHSQSRERTRPGYTGRAKNKKQAQTESKTSAQDDPLVSVWTRGWATLARNVDAMSARQRHRINPDFVDAVVGAKSGLSAEQMKALHHITSGTGGFAIVDGLAGTGKTMLLHEARRVWEASGKTVVGAALSGKATRELEAGSGIASRTIRSVLWHTAPNLDETLQRHLRGLGRTIIGKPTGPLQPAKIGRNSVLVIDESSLVSLPEMNRLAKLATKRGAKMVLVGDRRQLEALEQPGAFDALIRRHGAAVLTDVRRQQQEWMRGAVRQAAVGDVEGALTQYALAGRFHGVNKSTATKTLVSFWKKERTEDLSRTLVIVTTKKEALVLNRAIQKERRQNGELGWLKQRINGHWARKGDRVILAGTSRKRGFSAGETGTVKSIGLASVTIRLDRQRRIPILGFQVPIDIKLTGKDRKALMLGYAVTTFRAQGMSVDRAFVLHGGGKEIPRTTYVQLSRAVETARVFSLRDQMSASIRAAAAYAAADRRRQQKREQQEQQQQHERQQQHRQEMRP